jgi:two-component system KDP operon response regulator KdpE
MAELEAQLRPEAYRVRVAAPGVRGWGTPSPDLVLLDVASPEQDALAACRSLRGAGAAPLLLLTAAHTDRIVVEALEAGADGCLPARTSPRELAAWVRALLRRRSRPASVRSAPFRLGSLTIDLARGVISRNYSR